MAYKLLYDNKILFDPYSDNIVTDAQLTAKYNNPDYFDFTVSSTNSLYNSLKERSGLVELYYDNEKIFEGLITSIEIDLDGNKAVKCSGPFSYLEDTLVRPYSTKTGESQTIAPDTVSGIFQWYIDQHNKHTLDPRKQFVVGVNQGSMLATNNSFSRTSDSLPNTWDEIKNAILEDLGGFLFVEYKDSTKVLNLYGDIHETNAQIIDFGINITDFSKKSDTSNQYTAIRPSGYTPEAPENDKNKKMYPITIADLPDNVVDSESDFVKKRDIIYSISAVQKYGYKEYAYSNKDITDNTNLLKSAVIVLKTLTAPAESITVKAIDLALYMKGYKHLRVGQAVRIRSRLHDTDEYMMVNTITLDINNPSNTEYELGISYESLTGQQSSYLRSLNAGINSALDTVNLLDQATKDTAIIADQASKKAASAINTANSAQNTANSASLKADQAQNTANNASAKANDAETAAGSANKAAEDLKKKTAEIDKQVDAAKKAADSAVAEATETSNRVASVEQNLDGFKTTVADTYQTKDGMSEYATTSQLTQTKNSIESEVSTKYTTKADFNNLSIGGTNRIVLTDGIAGRIDINGESGSIDMNTHWTSAYVPVTKATYILSSDLKLISNEYVSVAFYDTDKKFISRPTDAITNLVAPWSTILMVPTNASYMRVSFPNNQKRHIKLEKGTKPTDWSPAPEDIQPAGDYSTKSYVDQTAKSVALGVVQGYKGSDGSGLATKSDITAATDNITSTVSKTYATKDGVTEEIASQITQNNDSLNVKFATKTENQKVQNTANAANATASNAQTRVGNLEPCIRMTSDGVRVGKQVDNVYHGSSALVGTDGTFDVLDSSNKHMLEMSETGLRLPVLKNNTAFKIGLYHHPTYNSDVVYIGDDYYSNVASPARIEFNKNSINIIAKLLNMNLVDGNFYINGHPIGKVSDIKLSQKWRNINMQAWNFGNLGIINIMHPSGSNVYVEGNGNPTEIGRISPQNAPRDYVGCTLASYGNTTLFAEVTPFGLVKCFTAFGSQHDWDYFVGTIVFPLTW